MPVGILKHVVPGDRDAAVPSLPLTEGQLSPQSVGLVDKVPPRHGWGGGATSPRLHVAPLLTQVS